METLEMKNILTEIPNSMDGFNSRMERTEERINELQDRAIKIIQTEKERKQTETNKQTKPQGLIVIQQKVSHSCHWSLKGEEKKGGLKKCSIVENLSNLEKDTNLQIQDERTLNKIN